MDIFHNNEQLEEKAVSGLDWGVFLRHDSSTPLMPFLYIYEADGVKVKVLATDDPQTFAYRTMAEYEKPYRQAVFGVEGFLHHENGERVDAIIIEAYDTSQPKGVCLAQAFVPKEQEGKFRKLGKASFLGHPELPVPMQPRPKDGYQVTEPGGTSLKVRHDDLTQHVLIINHPNPSTVAQCVRNFVRAVLAVQEDKTFGGRFEVSVTPGTVNNDHLLRFLLLQAVEEERAGEAALAWQRATGRTLSFNVSYGDTTYLADFKTNRDNKPATAPTQSDKKVEAGDYANLTEAELQREYLRIMAIPKARTNVAALTAMMHLMEEYERRGIPMPGKKSSSANPATAPTRSTAPSTPRPAAQSPTTFEKVPHVSGKKPWWKFW